MNKKDMPGKEIETSKEDVTKQRRYSRIEVECNAWLTINNTKHKPDKICDLSMGGVCIVIQTTLEPGAHCGFALHDYDSDKIYLFSARVVWKKGDRLALEFIDMAPDCHSFLQTIILYHANDPLEVAKEFEEDFPTCR